MKIEYTGVPTGKCKKFILKKQIKVQSYAALGVTVVFALPCVVAFNHLGDLGILPLIAVLIVDLFCLLPPGKQSQKVFMPKCIIFDIEAGEIIHECEKMKRVHSIDSVIMVKDYGEWYDLTFRFSDRDPYFVLQKDLLTKGTIEDFERLFKDVIVKK